MCSDAEVVAEIFKGLASDFKWLDFRLLMLHQRCDCGPVEDLSSGFAVTGRTSSTIVLPGPQSCKQPEHMTYISFPASQAYFSVNGRRYAEVSYKTALEKLSHVVQSLRVLVPRHVAFRQQSLKELVQHGMVQ